MKKISIVGVEGSGKTVMMAAMGEEWEQADVNGYFLSPESGATFGFSKMVMDRMRKGEWPTATTHDSMTTLEWSLRRTQNGRQEKIADISLLDFAGEIYRLAFGDAQSRGDGEYEREIAALRTHVDQSDVLIVLVNLSDIISGSLSNPRTRDAMWLTKSVLDYALRDKADKPHTAIVFTQSDSYKEIISANGGANGTLRKYLPHVFNLYSDLPVFTVSAINRTAVGTDGMPVPADGFTSEGLHELMNWMIEIGERDKTAAYEKEESARSRKHELITEFAPLVHLDVDGHKVQMRGRWWFNVLYTLPFIILIILFCVYYSYRCFRVANLGIPLCLLSQIALLFNIDMKKLQERRDGWHKILFFCVSRPILMCVICAIITYIICVICGHYRMSHYDSWKDGYYYREMKFLSTICLGGWLILSMSLKILQKQMLDKTKKVFISFRNGKWTEAMARKFVFVNDGFYLYYRAVCLLLGLGGYQNDYEKAYDLFYKSVKRDVAESNIALGWMTEKGMGVSQSIERAKQYYEEARSMGATQVPEIGE